MTTFFIDLWQDLREKRLWPVAVGLLAAIVAVPAVLFKPASDAAPPAVVVPPRAAGATLPAVAVVDGPTVGSRLETFSQKNPFKPMKDLAKVTKSTTPSGAPGSTSSGGSSPSSSSSSSATTASTKTGGTSSTKTGSGTSTRSGGTSTTPSGGTSPSTPATPAAPVVQWFRYTATFTFGEQGKAKKFASPDNMTLLPDDQHPAIVFMGVTNDHKRAVFFIADSALQAAGEGKCNASGAACRFVYLKVDESHNEETFSSVDGSVSYDVKLLRIQRQVLSTDKSGNPKPKVTARGKGLGVTGAGVKSATDASTSVVPAVVASGPGVARVQH